MEQETYEGGPSGPSIYRVTMPKQVLIASEGKLREWLGDRKFESLLKEGNVEKLEDPKDFSYGTAAM